MAHHVLFITTSQSCSHLGQQDVESIPEHYQILVREEIYFKMNSISLNIWTVPAFTSPKGYSSQHWAHLYKHTPVLKHPCYYSPMAAGMSPVLLCCLRRNRM